MVFDYWTTMSDDKVCYRPWRIRFRKGQPERWVLAMREESVTAYTEALRQRDVRMWRLRHRTQDGRYAFVNHYDGAIRTVPIDEFWRKP